MFFSIQRFLIGEQDFIAALEFPNPEEASKVRLSKRTYSLANCHSAQLREILVPKLKDANSILNQDLLLKHRYSFGGRGGIADASDDSFNGAKLFPTWLR